MTRQPIRVLIVDDSALIREVIADNIRQTTDIVVAGQAADGQKALEALDTLQPDVVTLDIQMPRMNGLETLDGILARRPVPVIMVSALTQRGADVTLEALDRGALDYVAKPESGAGVQEALGEELLRKIRAMYGADVRRMMRIRQERREKAARNPAPTGVVPAPTAKPTTLAPEYADKCIAIGISTGGPPALSAVFEQLAPPLPPIVVVQHMPAQFTKPFAWRLNSISRLSIKEAETGDVLQPNHVLIAPGGKHLHLRREGGLVKALVRDGDPVSGHKPSVDVMMRCVADIFADRALGIVMTGMGRDGSDGCGFIRKAGGYVLGQGEASSDVYGMNKVAFVEGNVDRQFELDDAPGLITLQCKRLWGRALAGAR